MSKKSNEAQKVIARGCRQAVQVAIDAGRLAITPSEQLGVAAAFLAKALAGVEDGAPMGPRRINAQRQLEAAGKAIGAELCRRQVADAFSTTNKCVN